MRALLDADPVEVEQRRRGMLADADELLGSVELLRLEDEGEMPSPLGHAIAALQERLGRNAPQPPSTVRAAHNLVFAIQQRLMAANPNNPNPRSHPGRGMGQPMIAAVASGRRWKFLTLPPAAAGESREEWLERIEETVERACDRWAYAHHQALRSAREGRRSAAAMAIADAAWNNYFELRSEADRLWLSPEADQYRGPGSLSPSGSATN